MTELRRTSEVDRGWDGGFPHGWPGYVCYFEVCDAGLLWLKTREETREAVRRALDGVGRSTLYAAWPGRHKTDLFLVDDVDKLARTLGVEVAV